MTRLRRLALTSAGWALALSGPSLALAASDPATAPDAPPVAGSDTPPTVQPFGFARAVPRTHSASRDAPVFGVVMAPRGIRTAASEFALVTVTTGPVTVRPAFYGLIELEGDGEAGFALWPSQQIHFWRGAFAFPVSVSFDAAARSLCATCRLEASVQFRHESEHYTGDNGGGLARDYSDRPIHGDAAGLEVAAAFRRDGLVYVGRLGFDAFLPGRSSYVAAGAVDLHVRLARPAGPQPFVSAFASYRAGAARADRVYPSAYLARTLLGLAFPAAFGEVAVYASGDVGHRVGLAAYTREATLGGGVRFSLGVLP